MDTRHRLVPANLAADSAENAEVAREQLGAEAEVAAAATADTASAAVPVEALVEAEEQRDIRRSAIETARTPRARESTSDRCPHLASHLASAEETAARGVTERVAADRFFSRR
jgi:hypothetical protein